MQHSSKISGVTKKYGHRYFGLQTSIVLVTATRPYANDFTITPIHNPYTQNFMDHFREHE